VLLKEDMTQKNVRNVYFTKSVPLLMKGCVIMMKNELINNWDFEIGKDPLIKDWIESKRVKDGIKNRIRLEESNKVWKRSKK